MPTAVESPPVVCSRCGAVSMRAGAVYCPACGQELGKRHSNLWLFIAAAIVLLLLVCGLLMFRVGVTSPTVSQSRQTVDRLTADLTSSPTALLQGGPPADQMSLSGLSLGSYLPNDQRIDGNEFLVADDRVSQIAIGRADILRACRVRDEQDIPFRFGGAPSGVQRDGGFASYDFARRGIIVEWDSRARRINRIILRPASGG